MPVTAVIRGGNAAMNAASNAHAAAAAWERSE